MAKRSASELFENYYIALIYLLPMKDASFVDDLLKYDLLPGDLKIRLASLTMNNQRASYFLDNVIKPGLAVGNSRCFVNLLTVIKEHDNCKELAKKIENELAVDIKCKNIYCIIIVQIRTLLFNNIDSSRPILKDLHNILIPRIANDWYQVSIQLFSNAQLPKLDEICTTHATDRRRGCVEMLKYWLQIHPEGTWDNLIHALREPGLELFSLADDVEKEVQEVQGY